MDWKLFRRKCVLHILIIVLMTQIISEHPALLSRNPILSGVAGNNISSETIIIPLMNVESSRLKFWKWISEFKSFQLLLFECVYWKSGVLVPNLDPAHFFSATSDLISGAGIVLWCGYFKTGLGEIYFASTLLPSVPFCNESFGEIIKGMPNWKLLMNSTQETPKLKRAEIEMIWEDDCKSFRISFEARDFHAIGFVKGTIKRNWKLLLAMWWGVRNRIDVSELQEYFHEIILKNVPPVPKLQLTVSCGKGGLRFELRPYI